MCVCAHECVYQLIADFEVVGKVIRSGVRSVVSWLRIVPNSPKIVDRAASSAWLVYMRVNQVQLSSRDASNFEAVHHSAVVHCTSSPRNGTCTSNLIAHLTLH